MCRGFALGQYGGLVPMKFSGNCRGFKGLCGYIPRCSREHFGQELE